MKYPMSFKGALKCANEARLTYRTRLHLDELNILCKTFYAAKSYVEIGVYDGLSAFMIAATTHVEHMYLIDINPLRNNLAELIYKDLGVTGYNHVGDFATTPEMLCEKYNWCLIDADHSYEATKAAYEQFKDSVYDVVLHDVEMPGPGQLFNEIGGVKIVSSNINSVSPDGKVLPALGYGILNRKD